MQSGKENSSPFSLQFDNGLMRKNMFSLLLITLAHSQSATSFLGTAKTTQLSVSGSPGLTFITSDMTCRIGYENPNIPLSLTCNGDRVMEFDENSRITFNNEILTTGHLRFDQGLRIRGVRQWGLYKFEVFNGIRAEGWSEDPVTTCGNIDLLGGFCEMAAEETRKEFTGLPDHDYLRIKAMFHFIDEWHGETGYMKVGIGSRLDYVWSQSFEVNDSLNPINVCGREDVGEGQLSKVIDIVVPHNQDKVTIAFGSTLPDEPCDASFGVSGLQIYLG